ncbi:MAG TPA: hypothetical protein VIT22_01220 [Pseudoxanthomonas sp.]
MSPAPVKPRKPFGPRRIAVLALAAIALAVAGWLYFTHAAGISGMSTQDMDWDADGTVTHQEMLQSFHAVGVSKTREGRRECSAYYWRKDQRSIRVDCRTAMAPEKE